MNTTKRILTLALALLMAVSLLLTAVSCGETADDPAESGSGTQAGTTDEIATESPYEQLEKEKYDRDFSILIRDDCKDDFVVEGMKGDVLGDSLYERNTVVGEDFGVEFVFSYQGNSYTSVNSRATATPRSTRPPSSRSTAVWTITTFSLVISTPSPIWP